MKSFRIILIASFFIISMLDLSHEFDNRRNPGYVFDKKIHNPQYPKSLPSEYFEDWYAPYSEWSPAMQQSAFEQIQQLPNDEMTYIRDKKGNYVVAATYPWIQDGPYGIQDYEAPLRYYSGRITTIDYHPSIGLLAGAASGGLWLWNGYSFQPKTDKLPSIAIGAVAINPSESNTIFLGTGEYQGQAGTGVYRSTDGGDNWTLMSLSPTPAKVSKIFVFTLPEGFVLVATEVGIYRSTNNGDTWTLVLQKNVSDISNSPGGFMLAGISGEGVYKSINWGLNWFPITTDLPTSDIGRVSVACAPNNVYKAYVQFGKVSTKGGLGVYKTTNSGSNWINVTPLESELSGGKKDYLGQQSYNNVITVHPTNSDIVWAGGVFLMRTSDGGDTWTDIGATGAGPRLVHVDIHALCYIDPNTFLVGSDGGLFTTSNEGATWGSGYNTRLPITQFYNSDIERIGGRTKAGGAQDNGLSATTLDYPNKWMMYWGGDGVEGTVNQFDPTMVFGTTNSNKGKPNRIRSVNASGGGIINGGIDTNDIGQTFWKTYIVQHPGSSKLFTNAGEYMYVSADNGANWSRMNEDPFDGFIKRNFEVNSEGEFVYVPVENEDQKLMKLHRFFSSWEVLNISDGLPAGKRVKRVHASPFRPSRVFAIINGIGDDQKIYMSDNYGEYWWNVTGNLPDVPVNDLCDDFDDPDVVYVGTDKGAYRTPNIYQSPGVSWSRWNSGMPEAVRIMDMEYVFSLDGNYIFAGTYGRSTFHRPVIGTDPHFTFTKDMLKIKSMFPGSASLDCVYVKNIGYDFLEISSVNINSDWIRVSPISGTIAPQESLRFVIYMNAPPIDPGPIYGAIEFVHNAEGSPTTFSIEGYVGDATTFRTFSAESLIVKKEVKRKTTSTSWSFRFDNNDEMRNPASALFVLFKTPVMEFISTGPFLHAECTDGRGKAWKFYDGSVPGGSSALICGRTGKKRAQLVNKWWWTADLVVWEGDSETSVEGILGEVKGKKLPEEMGPEAGMPNTATFRQEIFALAPFTKDRPLYVGIPDPGAKEKRVAYVAFGRHSDVYGSLTTGRSMIFHNGPPRFFDYYYNGKEMIGKIKKLKPDKHNNVLFADLIALKLNIYGSALEITPVGFGELKYSDPGHRLDGFMVRDIDSLADIYMTYGDSSGVGGATELDSVLRKINLAFEGPLDTVSFASGLEFTGVRPVAEVPFLVRDPSIIPLRMERDRAPQELVPDFELAQNYPNPFNPLTTIGFELPATSLVTLKVYNVLGQEVATLLQNEMMDEGEQEVEFDASHIASGVYLYRIVADAVSEEEESIIGRTYTAAKKMLVLK